MRRVPIKSAGVNIDLWLLFCHSHLLNDVIFYLGGIWNLSFHSFDECG